MEEKETKKLTLCDGCILVLIFGIAVFAFTPGVSKAVDGQKLSGMVDRLHVIRSRIKLYKTYHDGLLPGQRFVGDSVTPDAFAAALQQQRPDGSGPYLLTLLANPYIGDSERNKTITCVNDVNAMPQGDEETAWWFNAATGDFYACDSKFHTNY